MSSNAPPGDDDELVLLDDLVGLRLFMDACVVGFEAGFATIFIAKSENTHTIGENKILS